MNKYEKTPIKTTNGHGPKNWNSKTEIGRGAKANLSMQDCNLAIFTHDLHSSHDNSSNCTIEQLINDP